MIEQAPSSSCLVCRRRKVCTVVLRPQYLAAPQLNCCPVQIKCDRTPGSCNKCRALGEQCLYSVDAASTAYGEVSSSDSITQAGLKRRRVQRSCVECRRTKSKCSGGSVCDRCRSKAIECCFYDTDHDAHEEPFRPNHYRAIPTWLGTRNLPPITQVRELVDIYFAHIHSVRCLGFLHVPTFMEQFHNSRKVYAEMSGLIYIMCALAAPIFCAKAVDYIDGDLVAGARFFNAGNGWAEAAMQCTFSNFGNPSIECLMTEILLHEYYLRIGDYSKGFLISGFISRRVQLLQLNMENDNDILCQTNENLRAAKESRRRLLWACYLLDASIACGTDQLRFLSADDVQVQLPCAEHSFVRNNPCVTEMLPMGKLLPFVDQSLAKSAADNIDMRGYYIRVMAIRSKIQRYAKHLEDDIPWKSTNNSHFHVLDKELRAIENSLPQSLEMSTENIYIYKNSGRLNLFFGLHILISQTYIDLHRVGVPPLGFPNTTTKWVHENAPREFTTSCRRTCIRKAIYIGSLLRDLWQCYKLSIVDTPFAAHAQICSSVVVTILTSAKNPEPLLAGFSYRDCQEILKSNVRILKYLAMLIKADLYYESANQALRRFNNFFSSEIRGRAEKEIPSLSIDTGTTMHNNNIETNSPSQFSLEYILNPLGTRHNSRKEDQSELGHEGSSVDSMTPRILQPVYHRRHSASDITVLSHNKLYSSAADNVPSPDGRALSLPHWTSEMSIMDAVGYPHFLENVL
jgi:Fungal specific transcription factor domain